jgi:RNA polymerase sigma-70 factor (ECF subfamily)
VCHMVEKSEPISDLELVEKVKAGDRKSFSELVRRHQKGLMRLSLRFVRDIGTAEDVVQESFIKAFERLNSFEARASFKSWLFQIAVNTARNKIRERREGTVDIDTTPLAVAPKAETMMIHNAVAQIIAKLVETLPFRQKTALTLRIYEDLSFKEIAEVMECPYDTAKANYRHAILKLKCDLEESQELKNWTEEIGGFVTEMSKRVVEAEA